MSNTLISRQTDTPVDIGAHGGHCQGKIAGVTLSGKTVATSVPAKGLFRWGEAFSATLRHARAPAANRLVPMDTPGYRSAVLTTDKRQTCRYRSPVRSRYDADVNRSFAGNADRSHRRTTSDVAAVAMAGTLENSTRPATNTSPPTCHSNAATYKALLGNGRRPSAINPPHTYGAYAVANALEKQVSRGRRDSIYGVIC